MPEPNRKPLIALAIAVVVFALVGASQMRHREIDWTAVWTHAASIALYLNAYGLPFLLLAGTLIARRKSDFWALAVAAAGLGFAIASAVAPFLETYFYEVRPPLLLRIASLPSLAFGCIVLALLLSHRLRGRLDRLRLAACGLFAAIVLLNAMAYFPPMKWILTLPAECCRAIAGAICFFAVSFLAWCLAFRQAVPNRPPIDAAPVVALTCPRCNTPQQIASGHGQCTHCRLDITISLNEGVCRTCGYPLRGLTGEKCPECGTPIIPPDPDAQLHAWVKANDEHHGT